MIPLTTNWTSVEGYRMIMMTSSDVQLVESSIDEMTTTMNSEYCCEKLSMLWLWDYQEVFRNYISIIGVKEVFDTANMRLL